MKKKTIGIIILMVVLIILSANDWLLAKIIWAAIKNWLGEAWNRGVDKVVPEPFVPLFK